MYFYWSHTGLYVELLSLPNFYIVSALKLCTKSSLMWFMSEGIVVYFRSWYFSCYSQVRWTTRPPQHDRVCLRLLLYDLINKGSGKDYLWVTGRHRKSVDLHTLEKNVVLVVIWQICLYGSMWLFTSKSVSAQKIRNHDIVFQLRQWSYYTMNNLQMICLHVGHRGTKYLELD